MQKPCPGLTGYSDVIFQKIGIKHPSTVSTLKEETLADQPNHEIYAFCGKKHSRLKHFGGFRGINFRGSVIIENFVYRKVLMLYQYF